MIDYKKIMSNNNDLSNTFNFKIDKVFNNL